MSELKKLSSEELAALREQIRNSNNIKENTQAQRAAEFFDRAQESGKKIDIKMDEDRMSATMTLSNPGDEKYTVPELVGALRSRKIVVGIKSSVLMQMVSEDIYNTPTVVAEGKPVVPSVEGHYDFDFDIENHKTPEIREDGTADYSAVGRLSTVKAGDRIATYHPAVAGVNGYDILGNTKVAKIPREKPILRGQYIERNENTNEYFAKRSGKISLTDSNVEILDIHEVKGDVSIIQGTIEFFGDLYIHGNVESGSVIRAGRNIVIDGTVSGATINAGGDIILKKGIQGGGKAKISARGNVFADFIEHTKVEAMLNVSANSIVNSEVSAYGTVTVSGRRGSVIGGNIHGLKGIRVNNVGNDSEVKTVLHAGFLAEDYDKFLELNKAEKKAEKDIENLLEKITEIFKISSRTKTITPNQKEELLGLNEKKIALEKAIEQYKEDKADISRKMAMGMGATISVQGNVYRNVVICIDTATQYIMKSESYVKYVCKNEIIERRAI